MRQIAISYRDTIDVDAEYYLILNNGDYGTIRGKGKHIEIFLHQVALCRVCRALDNSVVDEFIFVGNEENVQPQE